MVQPGERGKGAFVFLQKKVNSLLNFSIPFHEEREQEEKGTSDALQKMIKRVKNVNRTVLTKITTPYPVCGDDCALGY